MGESKVGILTVRVASSKEGGSLREVLCAFWVGENALDILNCIGFWRQGGERDGYGKNSARSYVVSYAFDFIQFSRLRTLV